MATAPFEGFRILDCSEGLAGPMAAMHLADFGAEVIKVEPPGGERGRSNPGFPLWNRNKRGVTIDIRSQAGAARLRELLATADGCVFSQPLAELEHLGLDHASMTKLNPALVYLHTPPWPTDDESVELLCAATGIGMGQFAKANVPVDPVIPHVLYMQAVVGASGFTSAMIERERSGRGQAVTVGGIQAALSATTGGVTHRPGDPPRPKGPPTGGTPTYRLFQCSDGEWIFVAGLTPAFRVSALTAIGLLDEFLIDPRIAGEPAMMWLPENMPWVSERMEAVMRTKTAAEWLTIIAEAGCPCGPVWDRETWLNHPQLPAIGMWTTLDDPNVGRVSMPGLPINLWQSPASVRTPSPAPGGVDAVEPHVSPLRPSGEQVKGAGPLAGLRVLDLGAIIAGTYAGSILADFGADVLKVEPLGGDTFRSAGAGFVGYNLGKRSVALDLQKKEGRDAFLRLVANSDVVVDNYRPGVLQRLRIDYPSLKEVNPRIITVTVTGYGHAGPMANEPGFDPLLQAASGMMDAQGGGGDPVFFTVPVNDVASAATATLGAVIALLHRARTGEGQAVTTSLAAQSVMFQSGELVRYEGRAPARVGGTDYPGPSALDRYYATSDGFIRLQATDADRARLAAAKLLPGTSGLDDAGTAEALGASFAKLTRDEAVAILAEAGIAAAPARVNRELTAVAEFVSQGAVEQADFGPGLPVWVAGKYALFSRTQRHGPKKAPGLGEHSFDVLSEHGFSPEEIDALLAAGAMVQGGAFVIP
ncbi:MAG: CoA transferase [Thermoflexaceae bacterium]|nr:CoA transferase [Thermoflexaceae bacterium]